MTGFRYGNTKILVLSYLFKWIVAEHQVWGLDTSCSKFGYNHILTFTGIQTKIAIIHPVTDVVYPLLHHFHIMKIMYNPEEQNVVCKQVNGVPIAV